MSRLLYQAELHRRVDRTARRTGPAVEVFQSPFTESNRRPSPYHGDALPTELKGRAREPSETLPAPSGRGRHGGVASGSGPDEQPPVPGARRGGADARAGQQPALQPVL